MKNRISIKFYGKNTNESNVISVYMRVVMQRKKVESKLFSTELSLWNAEAEKVTKKHPDHFRLNLLIETKAKLVKDFVFVAELENRQLTIADVARLLKAEPVSNVDLFDFMLKAAQKLKHEVSHEHYRHYLASISKLKKWRSKAFVTDLNSDFIEDYTYYMKAVLKNHENTVTKNLIFLRKFAQIAQKQGLLKDDPFKELKFKRLKSNIQPISWNDVCKLESLLHTDVNEKIKNVVRWFLFSCYTGLRYSDLRALTHESIIDNKIVIMQQKTESRVVIPLSELALKHYKPADSGFVFSLYANQKCNEYLKLAAAAINYPGNLTFHQSRHTFGTLALNFGIPLEVVSELMGHADLKTTKIYAEFLDTTLQDEMKKFR